MTAKEHEELIKTLSEVDIMLTKVVSTLRSAFHRGCGTNPYIVETWHLLSHYWDSPTPTQELLNKLILQKHYKN